ncbi:MAG: VOC family protein [Myxococcales bacterium]|nr:VOC family protein [Myxococcales bacterium]
MAHDAANHHRIDYIELAAPDLGAAKAFYTETFGWSFTDWGDEYTAFNDGNLDGGIRRGAAAEGGPLVILFSTDLERSAAAVAANGGSIVAPIFSFPGGRRFHFKDPSGNVLAVWSDRDPVAAT